MASDPTVSDLHKAAEVTDQEIDGAVAVLLADLATEAYPLTDGYALDLHAAVLARTIVTLVVKDGHATERQKQHAVRTAILLARPTKR